LEENIKNLYIKWPKDINTDAKDLIMRILKKDPKQRLPLKEMIEHPFISKYFPDATKYLIKPEQNKQYKPYIACKDDPKVWKPEKI
jgi:serine/threonine protein kinase